MDYTEIQPFTIVTPKFFVVSLNMFETKDGVFYNPFLSFEVDNIGDTVSVFSMTTEIFEQSAETAIFYGARLGLGFCKKMSPDVVVYDDEMNSVPDMCYNSVDIVATAYAQTEYEQEKDKITLH